MSSSGKTPGSNSADNSFGGRSIFKPIRSRVGGRVDYPIAILHLLHPPCDAPAWKIPCGNISFQVRCRLQVLHLLYQCRAPLGVGPNSQVFCPPLISFFMALLKRKCGQKRLAEECLRHGCNLFRMCNCASCECTMHESSCTRNILHFWALQIRWMGPLNDRAVTAWCFCTDLQGVFTQMCCIDWSYTCGITSALNNDSSRKLC